MSAPSPIPAATYSVDFVNGGERVPVFSYNRVTRTLTPTGFASGRASIANYGSGWSSISIGQTLVMAITPEGEVRASDFSNHAASRSGVRLEFIRRAERGRQVVGTLTTTGRLSAWRISDIVPPDTTDQMVLHVNMAALGAGGLYCPAGFRQTSNLLSTVLAQAPSGNAILAASGKSIIIPGHG